MSHIVSYIEAKSHDGEFLSPVAARSSPAGVLRASFRGV